MPETHDGESAFTFQVAFSEDIGISDQSLREDAFTVTGGAVTRGRRVDDRRDLFEVTVQPGSRDTVTITLPAGRDCGTSGAICTKGENRRQLTNSPTATVAGPPNTAAAGVPNITGTARVAETLTAKHVWHRRRATVLATSSTSTSGWRTTTTYRERPTPPTPWWLPTKARPSRSG